MRNALIGHTGFIGRNLKNSFEFTDFYNSKNIDDLMFNEFDLIISAGNSSLKWFVNQNPAEDWHNINEFIKKLKTISVKKFILISTIDIYKNPIGVYEDTEPDSDQNKPYGDHRRILEQFVKDNFEDHLILRLPIVYGEHFTKNLIYDVLNGKQIDKVNKNSIIQIYNVCNLSKDIKKFMSKNTKIVNISTEPLNVGEMFERVFSTELTNEVENFVQSDMRSIYTENESPYHYSIDFILEELINFKNTYEIRSI